MGWDPGPIIGLGGEPCCPPPLLVVFGPGEWGSRCLTEVWGGGRATPPPLSYISTPGVGFPGAIKHNIWRGQIFLFLGPGVPWHIFMHWEGGRVSTSLNTAWGSWAVMKAEGGGSCAPHSIIIREGAPLALAHPGWFI